MTRWPLEIGTLLEGDHCTFLYAYKLQYIVLMKYKPNQVFFKCFTKSWFCTFMPPSCPTALHSISSSLCLVGAAGSAGFSDASSVVVGSCV